MAVVCLFAGLCCKCWSLQALLLISTAVLCLTLIAILCPAYSKFPAFDHFSKHRPSGPMLSISRFVHMSVCLSVCLSVHF